LPQDAGIEEYRQAFTRVRRAFSDAEWTLEDLLADGDRVVGRWSFRGTHDGPFFNIPPTGREVINPILAIYRIADGKITEDWHIFHSIGLWQALIQDIRELIDRATQPNPQSGV
jgi:predicted ester cyclase